MGCVQWHTQQLLAHGGRLHGLAVQICNVRTNVQYCHTNTVYVLYIWCLNLLAFLLLVHSLLRFAFLRGVSRLAFGRGHTQRYNHASALK